MQKVIVIFEYLLVIFVFILIPSLKVLTNLRTLIFTLQAIALAALGVILTFSVTHWKGPLIIGSMLLIPAIFSKIMGWYRDKRFWYLHVGFSVIMISYTGFLYITNMNAYKIGLKKHKELQAQVCDGRALNMNGWKENTTNHYRLDFTVLGQPYKLRATVQDDRKTFTLEVYRGYDVIGAEMHGGQSGCGREITKE